MVIYLLSNVQKRLIRETLSYFIDTTGLTSDTFIMLVQRNNMKSLDTLGYKEWLAVKSFELLQKNDISLADCLEFRNLATQLKIEKKGMNITSKWRKVIAETIEKTNIQKYELFDVSDKNSVFAELEKSKEFSVLDCESTNENFYNTFDFDSKNKKFYKLLPEKIQQAISYKLPIYLNVNPYLEHDKNIDALLEEMKMYGFNKKVLLNIYYASIFRIIRLCEDYGLTDIRIGIYLPLDMFYEKKEYMDFYKFIKSKLIFNSGICFNPKSLGVKDKSELIGYLIWDWNTTGKEKPIVIEEKIQQTDETILSGSNRLLRGKKDSLYEWLKSSTKHSGEYKEIPSYLSMQVKGDKIVQMYENVLGYQADSSNLLRSLKKVGVYSIPIGECSEITTENFYKSIASYIVRSCLTEKIDFNPIYLSTPDINIEGYKEWLADAVIYFIFSSNNMTKSYREKDLNLANRLFPLSFTEVRKYVTDENIINDMNNSKVENLEFIQILNNLLGDLSKNGRELYTFGNRKIVDSLLGKVRENAGYKDSLVAWDSSFYQIRNIDKLFDEKDEERYTYLLSKLKDKLSKGVYKFGFVSDI